MNTNQGDPTKDSQEITKPIFFKLTVVSLTFRLIY